MCQPFSRERKYLSKPIPQNPWQWWKPSLPIVCERSWSLVRFLRARRNMWGWGIITSRLFFLPHLPNSMWRIRNQAETNDVTSSPVCHLFFPLQASYTLRWWQLIRKESSQQAYCCFVRHRAFSPCPLLFCFGTSVIPLYQSDYVSTPIPLIHLFWEIFHFSALTFQLLSLPPITIYSLKVTQTYLCLSHHLWGKLGAS